MKESSSLRWIAFVRPAVGLLLFYKEKSEENPLLRKKQMKFFPDTYKNCIGKSYNDYIANHQMNMFEDFIGYRKHSFLTPA